MVITIETLVQSSLQRTWEAWTTPSDIVQWNFASPDWCCPSANVDLRVGGTYRARMEAKDGSFGFDFEATITKLEAPTLLESSMGDGRTVQVSFAQTPQGVLVRESFDAEDENSAEMQRQGWQAILDNFRLRVESKPN
ncbi:MAG: SRPBCC family protein [Fibrobacterota bacterium]|nr:SRPBCC family protein [Fibrobacterota bacterium]QQS06025.1 MAG: SRPBCC family protein [Fibrobacterota bacterium]